MKVVVLTSRFPFPIEKGDKLRMYHQLKYLSEKHEIHLISLTHDTIDQKSIQHLESICASINLIQMKSWKSAIYALRALMNTLPFQVNYFYHRAIEKRIVTHIDKLKPDVIYCQLIRMSYYLRNVKYPKVIDFMDAFSLNYRRRLPFENLVMKGFYRVEANRLLAYERKVFNQFNSRTIISCSDRKYISDGVGIDVISNGLDPSMFAPMHQEETFDLVFVGNMGYHPNVLAVEYLIRKIQPKLPKGTKILIAGVRPTAKVKALASENVKVAGWIDDIRSAYLSAKIFIAPIFSGAGQQNKILEAMSLERICITTDIVNESIGAEKDQEILIANNQNEFVHIVTKVLKDMDHYKKIGTNARKFVKDNFSWENENKKLDAILIKAGKEKR